jgi:Predicted transcription factor, homolog of eukaryotic MBF1
MRIEGTGNKMTNHDKLGKRVCTFREKLGLTQEELAVNAGLELSVIKSIESGDTYPPLGIIVKISRALGQKVSTFMDDQFQKDPVITRNNERAEEDAPHAGMGSKYHYFPLGKGKTDRHMEPLFIRIDAGIKEDLSSHEGEEFIIVVSGKIKLKYGQETHILEAGDSLYYNSIVPHYLVAEGGPAEIYAVLYVPV